MANINRSTLPQEFLDITSAEMLVEPRPQYLYAMLATAAVARDLRVAGGLGLPGRQVQSAGASTGNYDRATLMLSDPIASEAVKAVVELGKGPGQIVKLNRPSFDSTTYTEASRTISGDTAISVVPISISANQISITLKQYAGPYDSANSRVAPYGINTFDAKHMIHRVEDQVAAHMRDDYHHFLDFNVVTLLDLAGTTLYAGTAAAQSDMAVAGDHPFDADLVFRTEESLASANIPRFGNGKYMMVLHPRQVRQLKGDSQFARYVENHKERNPIFDAAFIGSLGGMDIFQSNTLDTDASTTTIYKGHAFGPGAIAMGVGSLPRVLASTDDNYSLLPKVIWEAELGFTLADSRFCRSLQSN